MSMPARVPPIEASLAAFLDSLLASGSGYPDMARRVPVDPERTVLRAGTGTALTAPRKVSRLQLTAGGLKVIWQSAGRRA